MRALITGITGQDGSYLAELLLSKGYEVVGVTSGTTDRSRITHIEDQLTLVVGDITDESFVASLVTAHTPDEIYNLASIATVASPWDDVPGTLRSAGLAPLYFLEEIRKEAPTTRFFQASSSQMYGNPNVSPQSETTPFYPTLPYGIGKLAAHELVGAYRAAHGLFATSGILFNHESPRRGEGFVTRKTTLALAAIAAGKLDHFSCGNLDARRDWGYAKEYVEAMWLMLQQEVPDDYVIATGETLTVRAFITAAAHALGIELSWEGTGLEEVGKDENGVVRVAVDPSFYRSEGTVAICGDITKIRTKLGWEPKTSGAALAALMAEADRID